MKLLTFRYNNKVKVGVLTADGKSVMPIGPLGLPYDTMLELIDGITDEQRAALENGKIPGLPLDEVELLAPIPVPRQDVLCLGINYMAHAEEGARYHNEAFGGERPFPIYFSKRVNEAVPHGGFIESHQDIEERLDYECELAVIIGKDAKNVKEGEEWDYIFGYTILNDISARILQTRHKQWYFGKSLDGFTPMGPWIVTRDEFQDPPSLAVKSYVNGELRQNSTTDLLIFDIPYVLRELTQGMTLKAGTIIAMGTPAGVGMGFDPPRFMKPGDVVTCEIEGIGKLTNTVK